MYIDGFKTIQGTAKRRHIYVTGSKTLQGTAKQRNQPCPIRCPQSLKDRGHLTWTR